MDKANYWKEIIKKQKESKQEVRAWCKKNNIAISSYYKWKKKLNNCGDETKPFIPVRMEKTRNQNITLEVNGITIQFDKELLPAIIQSIK